MKAINVCFLPALLLLLAHSNAEECACATGNVHIRSGAGVGHGILGVLSTDSCLTFKGHLASVSGTHWANVDYDGQVRIPLATSDYIRQYIYRGQQLTVKVRSV